MLIYLRFVVVFVALQNDAGAEKWPCGSETLETMRLAFQDRAE